MPSFSESSAAHLKTAHPDLQTLFEEVIKHYDCTILVGYRGKADQDAAVAAGKSKKPFPTSKHNSSPAMAVDAMPCVKGRIDWSDDADTTFFAGYVLGTARQLFQSGRMSHQIRYGGNWQMDNDLRDNKFPDLDHFELI
jgi:peptidoglycan L-alanyl-D-glutamate endopeptidase CwlK